MVKLPPVRHFREYTDLTHDPDRFAPAVEAICALHGVAPDRPRRCPTGWSLAFSIADRFFLKLYPPIFTQSWRTERAALAAVHGRIGTATPKMLGHGSIGGWLYLLTTGVMGAPIKDVLDEISLRESAGQLGAAVRRLHRLPVPPQVPATPRRDGSYRSARMAEQRTAGTDERWVARMERHVSTWGGIEPGSAPVLLHQDLDGDNILVDSDGSLSGVIDFSACAVGDPMSELVPVAIFVARGRPSVFRAFLEGYGIPNNPQCVTESVVFRRRLMSHAILHPLREFPECLSATAPADAEATDLDALADLWFGVS